MNINNGVPNGNNMAGVTSWHGMYTGEERQRVVQIIMDTLTDLHGSNPNFDFQRLSKMAQDFEKIVYEKSPSRDDYLKAIKSKVNQLRLQKQQVSGQSIPPNNQVNQQQQQQQRTQQMQARNSLNSNPNSNMSPVNAQNMQFLQQQAQARSQSQAQIQARQQQLRQMVNNQQGQGMQSARQMGAQPTPQQQQASAAQPPTNFAQRPGTNPNGPTGTDQQVPPQLLQLIRSSPIPPPLLSKIPNLPKGVTTWNQIFDCIKRKVISQDILPLVRDIHSTHMQLVMRQQQQKMNVRSEGNASGNNANPIGDDELKLNQTNSSIGNVNLNNLTPQQRQQIFQRQREAQQRQVASGASQNGPGLNQNFNQQGLPQQQAPQQQAAPPIQPPPQQQVPPQKTPFQQPQQPQQPPQPVDQRPPQFQVTQQDYAKYSNDALTLLNRLQQQKQIAGQLDANMKETFIRKYILHQKNQLWKQQIAAQSGATGLGIQNVQPQAQNIPQQPRPQIPQNAPLPMQQSGGANQSGKTIPIQQQSSPMIGTSNTPLMKPNAPAQKNLSSPLINQRDTVMTEPTVPPSRAAPGGPNAGLSSLLPPLTDEAKLRLRQLVEEVSRNNVLLRDVTTLLSPKDKGAVRDAMNRIQESYGNVDSIISYFYLFTKNVEGTKRLIQMKYMTKNILDNLKRGVYLAGPDLLEKLRNQYAKYFDYVKEQISHRRQQMAASANTGIPPTQPMPAQQQPIQSQQPPPQAQSQLQGAQSMMQGASGAIDQMFANPNVQASPHLFAPGVNQSPHQLSQSLPPQIAQQQGFANQGMPGFPIGRQPSQSSMQMNQNWGNVANERVPNNLQQQVPPPTQQQGQQVAPQQRNSVSQTKPKKAPPKKKRNSTVTAATPNAIASSIKTPHNVGTPQIQNSLQSPQIKNTPAPSAPTPKPNAPASAPAPTSAPSSTGPTSAGGTTPLTHSTPEIDIFSMSNDSVKRRELSVTDPKQFFVESMRKLLELDEPNKESYVNPSATLCAIATSFRQVQEIDEICENVF
ncbi:GAL11 [Candida margitis]|uniref:GAL11 n=1 Tax=Candida margitis TaxID=1775924 RepID=UPI0022273DF8|nr:GAL11 [Candida margitis]KAI5968662.1 GAL11 [Candida margitis]